MISIRSALSKCLVAGRGHGTRNSAAALMQANINVPIPSSSSSDKNTTSTMNTSVRYLSSPAYRRYLHKLQQPAPATAQDCKSYIGSMDIQGLKPAIPADKNGIQTPSLEVAKSMPWAFSEMENQPLVVIAEMGNHKARTEVLTRHIMMIDNVEYEEAGKTLQIIETKNREGMIWATLPYKIGIVVAMVSGIGAFPMVFDVDLALWFNHKFVTMEIPPPSDLDTSLETGAWTWNWMEPALGTASFTLLCFQYARQQIQNLGLKPYTGHLIEARSRNLVKAFPRYSADLLHSFVETDRMVKMGK